MKAVALQDLIVSKPVTNWSPIFVIDHGGLSLPLGEYIHVLRQRYRSAKFIVLGQERSCHEIVALLSRGIEGFVTYLEVDEALIKAVLRVAHHRMSVPAIALETYVRHSTEAKKDCSILPPWQRLTNRETQILELVKRRFSNKEVGTLLNIKESTVKFHLFHVFSKMRVKGGSGLHNKNRLGEPWAELSA